MRIRAYYFCVDERGSLSRARVLHGCRHSRVAGEQVRAVDALHQQTGKRRHELRQIAAWRLHFDRNGDRVPVVFDEIDDRQLQRAGGIERFPELAFAGRAFANRDVHDLVGPEAPLRIGDAGNLLKQTPGFRAPDGLQALRPRGARLRDDIEFLVSPMGRHLTAARIGIVAGAHCAQ
jgi:hypothetical protein